MTNGVSELRDQRTKLRGVAVHLLRWAKDHRLLQRGLSGIGESLPPQGLPVMSAAAASTFARRPITAVGINAACGRIFVYTSRALSAREARSLPARTIGDVEIEYRTLKLPHVDPGSASVPVQPRKLANGRLHCGGSISIGNVREAGTLGCLVRDAQGRLFGLSNNHVSGGCCLARRDTPIVAPGVLDVGPGTIDPQTLGHHRSVLPFRPGDPELIPYRENSDAALFEIGRPTIVSSMQGSFFDTPTQVVEPFEEMDVAKVGRTTGLTYGRIESQIVGPFPVSYKITVHHSAVEAEPFAGTVYFEPVYLVRGLDDQPFAQRGDSGSLVVTACGDAGARAAVGLLFGGDGPHESYMLPLAPILQRFGVELVRGHGLGGA